MFIKSCLFPLIHNRISLGVAFLKKAKMEDKYNVLNTVGLGKFYVPVEDRQMPVYLDRDVVLYLTEKCQMSQENLGVLVNYLLRRDIEIARRMAFCVPKVNTV